MLVIDILERRLVVLFMDGLSDPLRGWVKGHDPATLQEATKKACDLEPSSFRSRFQHRDSYMKKDKDDKKSFHKNAQLKRDNKLDNDTLNELRKKKLCFHCREPWDLSHKCPLKAKANQMEYFSAEESQSEREDQHSDSDEDTTTEERSIPEDEKSLA